MVQVWKGFQCGLIYVVPFFMPEHILIIVIHRPVGTAPNRCAVIAIFFELAIHLASPSSSGYVTIANTLSTSQNCKRAQRVKSEVRSGSSIASIYVGLERLTHRARLIVAWPMHDGTLMVLRSCCLPAGRDELVQKRKVRRTNISAAK